jgi:hypothetical protein
MQEVAKGFRRLKAHKQLPALRAALEAHQNKNSHGILARQAQRRLTSISAATASQCSTKCGTFPDVANGVFWIAGLDNLPDCAAHHRLPDRNRHRIRFCRIHATAHV